MDYVTVRVYARMHVIFCVENYIDPVLDQTSNSWPNVQSILAFRVISPREGEWADPGSTAIPGQPAEKPEQAPASSPKSKNQFNIDVPG